MNFAIGNRTIEDCNGVLDQKGDTHLGPHAEQDVFYPIPYANVPNLVSNEDFSHTFQITDQKEDHFRVRNPNWFELDIHWHTRGVRVGQLPPPSVPPMLSSAPQPELPPQPIPAQ
jgi:hypothetical protein